MVLGSVVRESGGFRWRRWYAVPVVMAALVADYGSPAEMWTAYIPLAFMAVLLTFRERAAALAVLFLSSWILLPAAAGITSTFDVARGVRKVYAVEFEVPGLRAGEYAECYAAEFPLTPLIEDGHSGATLGDRVLVRTAGSYAAMYNQLAIWHHGHGEACNHASSLVHY